VKITSDAAPGFGGISYTVPAGTTFAQLQTLSTDFMPEADDGCLAGSPRFQIRVPDTGPADSDPTGDNIFVYLGPNPLTPGCAAGVWNSSGDLLSPGMNVDTSQLGGTFYHEYSLAVAQFGNLPVLGVTLVVDAGYAFPADGEQSVLIDNTNINGTIYGYDQPSDKDQCKDGGWRNLTRPDGTTFKNQGDCVSYTNTGR
jgi:hypothetical protein